jgi:hypothetical protein
LSVQQGFDASFPYLITNLSNNQSVRGSKLAPAPSYTPPSSYQQPSGSSIQKAEENTSIPSVDPNASEPSPYAPNNSTNENVKQ